MIFTANSFRLLSGELEADILAGKLLVHSRVSVKLVLDILLVPAVKVPRKKEKRTINKKLVHAMERVVAREEKKKKRDAKSKHTTMKHVHLHDPRAIDADAGALCDDLSGEHKVVEDSLVDLGQCARARALLALDAVVLLLLGENPASANEKHVLARELLLELADEASVDALEALEKREGDRDDNGLDTARDVNLLGASNVQVTEIRLEVRVASQLKIVESLSNELLNSIGLGIALLPDLGSSGESGHSVGCDKNAQGKEQGKQR